MWKVLPEVNKNAVTIGELKGHLNDMAHCILIKSDGAYSILVVHPSDRISTEKIKTLLGTETVHCLSTREISESFPEYNEGINLALGNIYNLPVYCSQKFFQNHKISFQVGNTDKVAQMSVCDFLEWIGESNSKLFV
jgi:Ala-tRNA(Pro) deacylase